MSHLVLGFLKKEAIGDNQQQQIIRGTNQQIHRIAQVSAHGHRHELNQHALDRPEVRKDTQHILQFP